MKRTSTFLPLEDGSNGASHQTVTVPPRVDENAHTVPKALKIPPIAAAIADATPLPDGTTTRKGLTHGLERDTLRSSNATVKRTGKSMDRRGGQDGHIEKSGRWYVVRFWMDVPGQEKRAHKRERICPVSGLGSLGASARKRRAREIVQASGADTQEHFDRVVKTQTGITFSEQADAWYDFMGSRKNNPVKPSTLLTWDGIVRNINAHIGDLPLSSLMEDQEPVMLFVTALHEDEKKPKTIRNHMQVLKAVVASAKDKKSRKQLFPIPWDEEYLDLPSIGEQNTPSVTAEQVAQIVERAEGQYRVMFTLLAASGVRFGEILGLKIEHVLEGGRRLRIVEKNWNGQQQSWLKTINGGRFVELHSRVAAMLMEFIGDRKAGHVFTNEEGNVHSQSNILKRVLHPILIGDETTLGVTGVKAGAHAFRRYRNSFLRTNNCPTGLLKYWVGHSRKQDMTDVYDKSPEDAAWRLEMAERMGIGFQIPSVVPNVPSCTEEIKTAAGAAAVLSVSS